MTVTYQDLLGRLERAHDYGKYISALCPFHEDRESPSLLVFKDGWFRCLSASCCRHGNWTTLWNKLQGQPVQIHPEYRTIFGAPSGLHEYESLEELAYQAHMDLEQFPSWGWYLEIRGLESAIEIAEIGYHRGWYTFPVWDSEHQFQTAVFRSAPHVQEATKIRYWCNHRPVMYAPDWSLLKKSRHIFVVFGMMDALTLNKLRYPVVTSTAGADTFQAEWLNEFRVPIYILPDKGEERTAKVLASNLGWRGQVDMLDYPHGCKDANDYLIHGHEKKLLAELTRLAR